MAKRGIEVTDKVMGRIVGYEKDRVRLWIWGAAVILVVFGVVMVVMAAVAGERMGELGTLELADIFREDGEIIREFGREVGQAVWWELPKKEIFVALAAAAGLAGGLVWVKRRRKTVRQIWDQVLEYNRKKHG